MRINLIKTYLGEKIKIQLRVLIKQERFNTVLQSECILEISLKNYYYVF